MSHKVLDLFAGHGLGVAIKRLGAEEHPVEIWEDAIKTRLLNGLSDVVYRDVWDVDRAAGLKFDTLTGGPSCQLFSSAGTGRGRKVLPDLLRAIEDGTYQSIPALRQLTIDLDPVKQDDRITHVLLPLHYIWRYFPKYVLLEQVRAVLPIWEAYLEEMAKWGYAGETQVVLAEQFGVPQTRRRAILLARRSGTPASFPEPTHSRYYERTPDKSDEGVLPWVSMRAALGPVWDVERPAPTVTGGVVQPVGQKSSGLAGGGRSAMRSNYGSGGDSSKRGMRLVGQPAPAITSKADRNRWLA